MSAKNGGRLGTRNGIDTGPVTVGNMGGDVIFNYATHGDAINTAARMEGLFICWKNSQGSGHG